MMWRTYALELLKACGTSCLIVQSEVMKVHCMDFKELGLDIFRASTLSQSFFAKSSIFKSWATRAFDSCNKLYFQSVSHVFCNKL